MLKQGIIKIGQLTGFIDQQSEKCHDDNPCDSNGDTVYEIDGERIYERDFKQYRKFSPQFRQAMIYEDIQQSGKALTSMSCSCSKCGTVAIDEAYWM